MASKATPQNMNHADICIKDENEQDSESVSQTRMHNLVDYVYKLGSQITIHLTISLSQKNEEPNQTRKTKNKKSC